MKGVKFLLSSAIVLCTALPAIAYGSSRQWETPGTYIDGLRCVTLGPDTSQSSGYNKIGVRGVWSWSPYYAIMVTAADYNDPGFTGQFLMVDNWAPADGYNEYYLTNIGGSAIEYQPGYEIKPEFTKNGSAVERVFFDYVPKGSASRTSISASVANGANGSNFAEVGYIAIADGCPGGYTNRIWSANYRGNYGFWNNHGSMSSVNTGSSPTWSPITGTVNGGGTMYVGVSSCP